MKRENRSYEKVEESDGKIIEMIKGEGRRTGRKRIEDQRQEMEGEKGKEMKGRTVQEKETKSFDGERDWINIWKHNDDNNLYIFQPDCVNL